MLSGILNFGLLLFFKYTVYNEMYGHLLRILRITNFEFQLILLMEHNFSISGDFYSRISSLRFFREKKKLMFLHGVCNT